MAVVAVVSVVAVTCMGRPLPRRTSVSAAYGLFSNGLLASGRVVPIGQHHEDAAVISTSSSPPSSLRGPPAQLPERRGPTCRIGKRADPERTGPAQFRLLPKPPRSDRPSPHLETPTTTITLSADITTAFSTVAPSSPSMPSSSSRSSIEHWLHALPHSGVRDPNPNPDNRKRKREFSQQAHDEQSPKRRPLGILSSASANERSNPRRAAFSRSPATITDPPTCAITSSPIVKEMPNKRRVFGEEDDDVDVFATPRPSLRQPESDSDASSRRSQSPVKMAEFAGLTGGSTTYEALRSVDEIVPGHPLIHLYDLLDQAQRFSMGEGIVTSSMKIHAATDRQWKFYEHNFADASARDMYGSVLAPASASELCAETLDCKRRQETEAGWNCRVHYPILKMARDTSRYKSAVRIANITTAGIQPSSLLPHWRNGKGVRTKLVDFAITLVPDAALKRAYPNLEAIDGAPSRSFNSTCLNTVLQEPIAVSVETKTQDGQHDKAVAQLFTWAAAQIQRLVRLARSVGRDIEVPLALPLLSVHGSLWRMYVLSWTKDVDYILWDVFDFGETDTPLGLYKVLAVLQLLMHWAENDFRPWLHRIIPLTPDERADLNI